MVKQTKEISVQQGLNELKLYDSKIRKANAVLQTYFVVNKNEKMHESSESIEEVVSKEKSKLRKVLDLIDNRDNLKQAIVLSNALTEVVVAGDTYTVAEAIEKKTSIQYKQNLVARLNSLHLHAKESAARFNQKLDKQLEKNIEALTGSNQDDKDNLVKTITGLEEHNETKKVNVYEFEVSKEFNNIELIDKLSEENESFLSEVDYILTQSNVITKIEVTV